MNERLRALIAETLGISVQAVELSLRRDNVDGWDSLSHLRLITAIEETFGIQFSMEQIQSTSSVGDLVEVLARHGVGA